VWRGWEDSYGEVEDLNKGERGGLGGLGGWGKLDSLIEHSEVRKCVVATPRVVIGFNFLGEKKKLFA
jgi:hypothetical protein